MTAITWTSAVSGDWSTTADWNPASIPGAGDDVTIAVNTAAYTLTIGSSEAVDSVTLNASNATLEVERTLTLGGVLTLAAGKLELVGGGTIAGGTIAAAGGSLATSNGTLNAVTYQGTLDLSATSASLTILGGIALTGAGGTGPGTVNLTGLASNLFIDNATTLNNATINLGNAGGNATLTNSDPAATGAVLTLGSQLALVQAGANARLQSGASAGDGIVNLGTISAGISHGNFTVDGRSFTNQGSLAISNGAGFIEGVTNFDNAGTITVTGAATLSLTTGWTNTGTIGVTDATLNLAGTSTTSAFGAIGFSAGTLEISGLDSNTGSTLDVSAASALGTVTLLNSGTIQGGTIATAGGTVVETNGVLDGVTYDGTLDLSATSANLTVVDGITLTGAGGTGPGTVNLTGFNTSLSFVGTTTLNNATIDIGNASLNAKLASTGAGAVLTLGSHVAVIQTAANTEFLSTNSAGAGIVNEGSISAGFSHGAFTVIGNGFTNQASIGVSNGETFTDQASNFANSGTLTVSGASTLVLTTGWTNSGSISVTASTLNLTGTTSTSAFGALDFSAGTLDLSGLDINTGSTLDFSPGSALGTVTLELAGPGRIQGGVVNAAGGTLIANGGTLDGVRYDGTLDLSPSSNAVTIVDGITLTGAGGTGPGTVNLTGFNTSLSFVNTTTLDNATINVGNASGNVKLISTDPSSIGSVLTLGSQVAVIQTGANTEFQSGSLAGDGIINQGSISAGFSHGAFTVIGNGFTNQASIGVSNGETFTDQATHFANTGSITVTGGSKLLLTTGWTNTGSIGVTDSTLNLTGTSTTSAFGALAFSAGTLDIGGLDINTGSTLDFSAGGALGTVTLELVSGSTIQGGAINSVGGTLIASSGTLDGVTYEGTLDLSANSASLSIVDGITLTGAGGTGPGTVNLTGFNGSLSVYGTTTLNNATINIGNASDNARLISVDPTAAGAVLTLGTQLGVVQAGTNAELQGGASAGDGIVNQGSIGAGLSGGRFTVLGNSFTNQSSIVVSNGDIFAIQSTTFTNLSGTTLTGGSYEVDAGSVLQLQNNLGFAIDDADITLSGTGSVIEWLNTTGNHQVTLDSALTTIGASGTLDLLNGRTFAAGGAFTNNGLLELGGATFSSGAFANAGGGSLFGFGTFNAALTDNSSVEAHGGLLTLASTVGGTGGFTIDAGSTLEFASSPASGQITSFNGLGATLKMDAPSSFAGTIGSFSPGDTIDLAGVTTVTGAVITGDTLTVSLSSGGPLVYPVSTPYAGDHLKVVSDGATGTDIVAYGLALPGPHTPEPVSLGEAHVGAVVTQALSLTNTAPTNNYYETLDAGVGGATAGVTAAGSFSLLAAGATDSTHLVVGLDTSADGDKSGTATITLMSDGTGVDGLGITAIGTQTVNISGAVYNYATASAATPNPVNFADRHVGAVLSQALSIENIGTVDAFTEKLDASIGGATGSASASGSFTGLGAGVTNASSLTVGLGSAHDGVQSGTSTITLTSDGAGIDTLGTTPLTAQTVTVEGTFFNFATASAAAPNPVNFADRHVGDVLSQALSIENIGTVDAFTEKLDASIGGATGAASASGSFTGLGAGVTNASSLTVGLGSAHDGAQSGTATITLTSDGATIDTLGTTPLAAQTVTVEGTFFNFATASAAAPNPVNFADRHVGAVLSQALSIENIATVDAFTEKLDASIGGATGSASASGSFTGLGAGVTNASSLTVGLGSAHDGAQSGTATITLTSDGATIDTLGTTPLAAQTVTVEGTFFNFATASAAAPNPVNFADRHVGAVLSQALSIENIGTVDAFTEKLDASIGGATGSASASGSFTGLGAGVTNASSLTVGLGSAHDGAQSGTATITLTSDGATIDTLGTTALAAQTVTVEGTFYNFATASPATPNPVNFTDRHVGAVLSQALSIENIGTVDAFTEKLDASIGSATGAASASGAFSGLGAGITNASSLTVGLGSAHDGAQSGTATITLTSDGATIDTLGTTALAAQTVTVEGTFFNYATASAATPNPVNFTDRHVGAVLSQALSIENIGTVDAFTEKLDASIGSATGAASASGAFSGLGAGITNASSLTVGLGSAHDGAQSGTATITLTSDGATIDTLGTTALAAQTVTVEGTFFNFATASPATPNPVNFADRHVGAVLSQALSIENIGTVDAFTEKLNASIGGATGAASASGSFTGLGAGVTNASSLTVGLGSAHDGAQSGTATITLTSDGATIDTLGTTALTAQTVTVEGTFFNFATASAAAPNPVNFADRHVGAVLSQALSIENAGTVDGFTEKLDASIGGATGAASASGSFTGLGAGVTNASSLTVGLGSAHDGAQSGTATITLTSDGATIDTLGTTPLAAQTVTVEGTFFNFATASAAAPNPVNFADRHVGDVLSQALSIENIGTVDAFTEKLNASIGGATGSASASGSFTGLGAGITNASSLTVGLGSAHDGAQSGTATITLTSDGATIDTLGTTALAAQTVTVEGTFYNFATASPATPNPVNFGIVHVGTAVSQTLSISNLATVDNFSEKLDGSIGGATGGVIANGSFTGLAASTPDTTDLSVGVNTSSAGTISGTATITLRSDGAGIDTLGTTVLTGQTVTVDATVNNYATATIEELSGGGVFDQDGTIYTLNLGTIVQGTTVSPIDLGVLNDVSGPSDLLSGSFTDSISGAFGLTGFGPFSGLEAGQVNSAPTITVSTTDTGSFTETVTLTPDGSNASGFNQMLQQETLTISADVVPCFLAGTLIGTEHGEVLVETLKAGDTVVTLSGKARKLAWVGTGRVLATRGRRNAATPVIVQKGALGDNMPHQDLRVTKGHALYLDGALIPVEYLVNHRSIIWDDRAQEVTIFHLELDTHDVLVANGAPAESYRDDGNRWLFQNANTGWDQAPKPPCAPVLTGGPLVDAVWRRLLDRSGSRPNFPLTEDPDLHLLVDGHRLEVASHSGEARLFKLPGPVGTVCIMSRAAAPAELGRARDPRSLGVAVQRIILRQGTRFQVIEANDGRLVEGFHTFEPEGGFRWTNGEAVLPGELFAGFTGPLELLLVVSCTAQYVDGVVSRAA